MKKNSSSILKKRFIEEVDNTKLLGIYSINEENLKDKDENLLLNKFKNLSKKSNLIIISDYGHNFFTKSLRNQILKKIF